MFTTREICIAAFALFSLFFGAGNLILPPSLGFRSGELWWLVTLGFCISAVVIPVLGIAAHAKLQGPLFDFAKKVSPTFSYIYAILIYAISLLLPSPRTAAVTHEMAIAPFFNTPALLTSVLYFSLVFIITLNRSKILDLLGKLLTPAIILILIAIIGLTLFSSDFNLARPEIKSPFTYAILEGYQTFDAIAALVVGGVLIVSINLKQTNASFKDKKILLYRAGLFAGVALFLIYGGLIFTGASFHGTFAPNVSRTTLLRGISLATLGSVGNLLLSVLIGLACFTTAVGVVTGTADFVKSLCKDSHKAYVVTALLGCTLGVLIGQLNVDSIIAVALPALMFIYPVTLVLILLNVIPNHWASPNVFKTVVLTTLVFSVPDFLGSIDLDSQLSMFKWIPLQAYQMGWVLPAFVAFGISNVFLKTYKHQKENI